MKEIKLSGEIGKDKFTLIDNKDFKELNRFKWNLNNNGYIVRSNGNYKIFLHREILKIEKGLLGDHINGNKLDNRRENLRICTNAQNTRNQRKFWGKSQFKGVSWNKPLNKWTGQITFNYKKIHIGCFQNERHAAMAYDIWAKELFGKFSNLNFNPLN